MPLLDSGDDDGVVATPNKFVCDEDSDFRLSPVSKEGIPGMTASRSSSSAGLTNFTVPSGVDGKAMASAAGDVASDVVVVVAAEVGYA